MLHLRKSMPIIRFCLVTKYIKCVKSLLLIGDIKVLFKLYNFNQYMN